MNYCINYILLYVPFYVAIATEGDQDGTAAAADRIIIESESKVVNT